MAREFAYRAAVAIQGNGQQEIERVILMQLVDGSPATSEMLRRPTNEMSADVC